MIVGGGVLLVGFCCCLLFLGFVVCFWLVVLFCFVYLGFLSNTNEEMDLQRGFLFYRRKKRKKHEKKRKQHEHESPAWENESAIWQLEFILIFSRGELLAINSDTELVSALSLLSFLCHWSWSSLWIKHNNSACKVFVKSSLNWAQYQKWWNLKHLKNSFFEKDYIVLWNTFSYFFTELLFYQI